MRNARSTFCCSSRHIITKKSPFIHDNDINTIERIDMAYASSLPHPYGAKPSGNALLLNDPHKVRRQGLGRLNVADAPLLELLSFFDAEELARFMLLSRAAYVFANHLDLWRDLTLRRWNGSVDFVGTWRDTFVRMLGRERGGDDAVKNFQPHVPIRVTNIFSDVLHRCWVCHTCEFEYACPGFYSHNDIPRRDANDLSVDAFIDEYEMLNKPVIISNAVNHWVAMQTWSPTTLINLCQNKKFRATSATAPVAATFTMEQYFSYAAQTREEAAMYLFDRDFHAVGNLGTHYDIPRYFNPAIANRTKNSCGGNTGGDCGATAAAAAAAVAAATVHGINGEAAPAPSSSSETDTAISPKSSMTPPSTSTTTKPTSAYATDLFRVFGETCRPDYRWLIAGPKRSGSIFHIDPNQTNAWNVCVKGRKKWIFYPPSVITLTHPSLLPPFPPPRPA